MTDVHTEMASSSDRAIGNPGSGSDRADAAVTPSAQFLAAAALDLDLEMAAAAAGGGISPDSDQEPDPPEIAAVINRVFNAGKGPRLISSSDAPHSSIPQPAPPSLPAPSPARPSLTHLDKPLRLANVSKKLDDLLRDVEDDDEATPPSRSSGDRLGPNRVTFDSASRVGNVVIDNDQLGVTSQSNFSTVRANACVFSGKWVYELMLGSKGVMQVGWCTVDCKFSGEEGVGDTPASYAYDGNRLRKWNVNMSKYGEPWLTGDVISCAIDCDEGTISFCHNGKNMGCAFDNVRLGPGIAYFPALSLSFNENVRINFGATPLRFPLEGYAPLQAPPAADLRRARLLTSILERLVEDYSEAIVEESQQVWKQRVADQRTASVAAATGGNPTTVKTARLSRKAVCILLGLHIFDKLSPLLKSSFITESCLVKLLMRLCDGTSAAKLNSENQGSSQNKNSPQEQQQHTTPEHSQRPHQRLHALLDLTWTVMDANQAESAFENVFVSLLTSYRFSPTNDEFKNQHVYLRLTLAILKHETTRKFLIKKVLFDKIKFPIFMHVKPPDDATLADMVPEVWWPASSGWKDGAGREPRDEDERRRREAYDAAVEALKAKIKVLEDTQTEILTTLLTDSDTDGATGSTVSSQYVFLYKLREFIRENLAGSRLLQFQLCPLPVILCFFHRLIAAAKRLWVEPFPGGAGSVEVAGASASGAARSPDRVPFEEAFVPLSKFFDDSLQLFETQRLGGLESHLKKTLKTEIQTALGSSQSHGLTSNFPFLLAKLLKQDIHTDGGSGGDKTPDHGNGKRKDHHSGAAKHKMPEALIELVDDIILMYHVGAHKQLRKMSTLRENMQSYVQNLEESETKLANCPPEATQVMAELERARKVFEKKVREQARHMAWVSAVVYFDERQRDVAWLMNVILGTFENASGVGRRCSEDDDDEDDEDADSVAPPGGGDPLLAFIPDYYVEVIINAYYALKNFFHPTVPYTQCPRWKELLVRFAEFLSDYFRDPRIVHSDSRDSLIQALACFVCYPHSLEALESMPRRKKLMMAAHLISPYENRSWAQTNWILVRLWKGCGFGFRYTQLPHFAGRKDAPPDIASAGMQKPCPSSVFQSHVKELLERDEKKAVAFLNSILNQLNWAFSEFIGMLQEIQQIAGRPERNFVDSRQLKIAATCFDLTVGLLRVLEMIVHLCPQLFLDWDGHSSSESLLLRLCQLISQLLSRITTKTSLFDTVVAFQLPGMESVDHYPILTAVTGILVELISRGSNESRDCATEVLVKDPSFNVSAIQFLLEEEAAKDSSSQAVKSPTFSAPAVSEAAGGASRRSNPSIQSPLSLRPRKKKFSFLDYPEHIAPSEIQETEFLVAHLSEATNESRSKSAAPNDEDLCPICCSNAINVQFRPCKHRSCKACIMHHLMNNKECFFCKATVTGYEYVACHGLDDNLDLLSRI